MVNGVVAELNELIDFRRYAQSTRYSPEGKAVRSGAHLSKIRGRGMDFLRYAIIRQGMKFVIWNGGSLRVRANLM